MITDTGAALCRACRLAPELVSAHRAPYITGPLGPVGFDYQLQCPGCNLRTGIDGNHLVVQREWNDLQARAKSVADLHPSTPWPAEWREGMWPIESVLAVLADAADHLLGDHCCDRHGYEKVRTAATLARQMLADVGYTAEVQL